MRKAAAAAAGAVLSGVAALGLLAGHVPMAWAEGAALVLTGATLLGASFLLEEKKPGAEPAELPAPAARVLPAQRAEA